MWVKKEWIQQLERRQNTITLTLSELTDEVATTNARYFDVLNALTERDERIKALENTLASLQKQVESLAQQLDIAKIAREVQSIKEHLWNKER